MLFFNLSLPKAGTKIGHFPLYISVIITLIIILPLMFYKSLKNYRAKEEKLALIYIGFLALVSLFGLTFENNPNIQFSSFISELCLPYLTAMASVFLIFTAKYSGIDMKIFKYVILTSFFLLTVYGLIQKIFGDMNTIIPGITFNYAESIGLHSDSPLNYWAKHNYNEALKYIKLSSTYQNGNLFGVNYIMLSWFAFYFLKEGKKLFSRIIFYSSIIVYIVISILTASATVYIGAALSLILLYCRSFIDLYSSGRKNKKTLIALFIIVPAVLLIFSFIVFNYVGAFHSLLTNRLLGRDLLGNERVTYFMGYIKYLEENKGILKFLFGSFFTNPPNTGGFEITLIYIFVNSGILFALFFVFFIFAFARKLKFTVYNIGIFSYIVMSFFDGGFWLPPTPFSFFTLLGMSIYLMGRSGVKEKVSPQISAAEKPIS